MHNLIYTLVYCYYNAIAKIQLLMPFSTNAVSSIAYHLIKMCLNRRCARSSQNNLETKVSSRKISTAKKSSPENFRQSSDFDDNIRAVNSQCLKGPVLWINRNVDVSHTEFELLNFSKLTTIAQ